MSDKNHRLRGLLADLDALSASIELELLALHLPRGHAVQLRNVAAAVEKQLVERETRESGEEIEREKARRLLVSAQDAWGSCARKASYKTLSAAGRAAARAKAAGSTDELRIYQCPICDGYHLTHMPLERLAR